VNQDEINRMDAEIDQLTAAVKEAEAKYRATEGEIAQITREPTTAEADAEIIKVQAEIAKKQESLAKLSGGGGKAVTKEDVDKAQAGFNKYHKEFVRRKRAAKDMVDQYCESSGKKPKQVMENMGIETDEEVGVDIKAFDKFIKKQP